MKDKIRKCIGCQKSFDRTQMFRILKNYKNEEVILEPSNKDFGRSVYICKTMECIEKAFKKGSIGRSLKCKSLDNLKVKLQKNLTN